MAVATKATGIAAAVTEDPLKIVNVVSSTNTASIGSDRSNLSPFEAVPVGHLHHFSRLVHTFACFPFPFLSPYSSPFSYLSYPCSIFSSQLVAREITFSLSLFRARHRTMNFS